MQIKNSRCANFIRDFITILGGQYLVYHSGKVVSSDWRKRWNKQIVKGKNFYIVGSGNDGDYNDELLIHIEEILNWFAQNKINQDKVIFMTSNLNLNYGLSNLKDVVKRDGIRLIEKWDYVIKQFDTESVPNIKFCPYIYNVGDHPLDYEELIKFEEDKVPDKLFSATMWTERVSNDILYQALYDSNLIHDKLQIDDSSDFGWVSYGEVGRLFREELYDNFNERMKSYEYKSPPNLFDILEKGETWHGSWQNGGDGIVKTYIVRGFINLVVESNCDYTLENESEYYLKKTQQYYRSRMTSTYLTEKTMFPMLLKRPFLIWGGYGCLDALKELGFKTFDRIFDESYQYERDAHKKVDMILKQLVQLKDKSKFELLELHKSVEDILEHNQRLLIKNYQNQGLSIGKYIYTQLKGLNLC